MKKEKHPNEYMDLAEEHRLSEQAAKELKRIPPAKRREQAARDVDVLGEIGGGILEFIFEVLLEALLGGL